VVRAAGGVVVRDGRVAVVHRPKYDDWSLPKGKLQPGESWEAAALREVEEETGLACRLQQELPAVEYEDSHGRCKTVRYWRMAPADEGRFAPRARSTNCAGSQRPRRSSSSATRATAGSWRWR